MTNPILTFNTLLTRVLSIKHPIVLAPMCGMATGELAGAVARAGGVGLIGIGAEGLFDFDWIKKEADAAKSAAGTNYDGALGFGFIGCFMKENDRAYRSCLELKPDVVFLAYSDNFATLIDAARRSEAKVICQVHTVEEAVVATENGADIIALQGCDAGGHGKQHLGQSIVSLVPQARDVLEPEIPLLAAGGIVDGRGLSAALALGGDGVVMGSRFVVTHESKAQREFKDRILECRAAKTNTIVSSSFDILSTIDWPLEFRQGRAISDSRTIERFHQPVGSEQFIPSSEDKEWYKKSGYDARAVWASAASGLINLELSAKDVIEQTIEESKKTLSQL